MIFKFLGFNVVKEYCSLSIFINIKDINLFKWVNELICSKRKNLNGKIEVGL